MQPISSTAYYRHLKTRNLEPLQESLQARSWFRIQMFGVWCLSGLKLESLLVLGFWGKGFRFLELMGFGVEDQQHQN